jgi:hypothetical protein
LNYLILRSGAAIVVHSTIEAARDDKDVHLRACPNDFITADLADLSHPFVRPADQPSVPTCSSAERRAQTRSMLPKAPEGLGIDGGEHGAALARLPAKQWSTD